MTDVKWIKIVTDIFDDDKILLIESMPEADAIIVIWFKLLCLAGKQNNSGVFMLNGRIAYTEEMFSTIFRRPLNTVRLALKTFEQFGMIEIINDTITIPNWEKHQKLDALEMSREATRNRVAKYRAKQKQLISSSNVTTPVTVTPSNGDRIDKNKNIYICSSSNDDGVEMGFSRFWEVYPRRVSKADAMKAWKALKPKSELVDTIVSDIRKKLDVGGLWNNRPKDKLPYPATYIRGKQWEDEDESPTQPTDQSSKPWNQMSKAEQTDAMRNAPYGKFY